MSGTYRRRRGPKPSFWFAVVGIVVLTPIVENIVVDRYGDKVPGLEVLNHYKTRKNG